MTTAVTTFVRRGFSVGVVPIVLALGLAAVAGGLLAQNDSRFTMLVILLALAAATIVVVEAPILLFGILAVLLGLASGDAVDSPVPNLTTALYTHVLVFVLVVGLLLAALALQRQSTHLRWPGWPATVVVVLSVIAIVCATRVGSRSQDLVVVRPLFLLLLSIIAGFWLADRYGTDLILKILVGSGALATVFGLYNIATGHVLSFYDSSFILLIGVTATLVLFSAVDIGVARFPFLIAAAVVIVFSFRRGTIIAVAITILITGLVKGRGGFRATAAIIAVVVVGSEIVMPGVIFDNIARLVDYFSGGSGNDFSVNYREYETSNAWLNVKDHWLGGIGPSTDWILYRTFGGRFRPLSQDYLHNSYLWVWLRFSLFGLLAYVGFFVACAATLIRRSAPVSVVIIGSSTLGVAFAAATASFLTTTVRWPLLVGLLVGVALFERDEPESKLPA